MTKLIPSPRSFSEAEQRFARRMTRSGSPAEEREFERWLAQPENAAAYAETERLWRDAGALKGSEELERMSAEALTWLQATRETAASVVRTTLTSAPRGRSAFRLRSALAASLLICAIGAGAFFVLQSRTPALVYATERGERSTITLADGSKVFLNTDTTIAVRMKSNARDLTLNHGEALFEVAHDAPRPFRVTAGSGEVTALGTRFQVRNEAEHVTVTLLEGRVAVDRADTKEHTQLNPGDQVRFASTAPLMTRRTVDPDVVASWTSGRLRFRSTPLGEVVDEVNRYAETKLRLSDRSLAQIPVSGTFPMGDSESVAVALEALLPIEAEENQDSEILLRRP